MLNLLENLARLGLDPGALSRAAGIGDGDLDDTSARVPWRAIRELFRVAEQARRDPLIGLHAARMGARGLLAYGVAAQPTVEAGLQALIRWIRVPVDGYDGWVERLPGGAALVLMLGAGEDGPDRHSVEYLAGVITVAFTLFTHERFRAQVVRLPHAAGGAAEEYERVLRCPVSFSARRLEIVVAQEVLEQRLDTASLEAVSVLTEALAQRLSSVLPDSLRARVGATLRRALVRGEHLTLAGAANVLRLSARTLQRQLAAEDTSFRELLKEVRLDHARTRLRDPDATITSIAAEVGFADGAAFSRAFRRRFGTTPAQERGSQRSARGRTAPRRASLRDPSP